MIVKIVKTIWTTAREPHVIAAAGLILLQQGMQGVLDQLFQVREEIADARALFVLPAPAAPCGDCADPAAEPAGVDGDLVDHVPEV